MKTLEFKTLVNISGFGAVLEMTVVYLEQQSEIGKEAVIKTLMSGIPLTDDLRSRPSNEIFVAGEKDQREEFFSKFNSHQINMDIESFLYARGISSVRFGV